MSTVLELAQARTALKRTSSDEWHGPCPFSGCGGTDRFWVNTKTDRYFCRQCSPRGGDAVMFLRQSEGLSCPEAHASLGKECDFSACPMWSKCSQGKGGEAAPRQRQPQKRLEVPAFVPDPVKSPLEIWRERAEKLIVEAHAALLNNPEQLAYLAGRGLPLAAVVRYRLGLIVKDYIRPRAAWGLPEKFWDDGVTPKKLKISRGLLIPTFVDVQPHRLRIRRDKRELKPGEAAYLEVEGSGNDRVILNPSARAVAVVESDLDALMIDYVAGDIVGAMPVVSCQSKPKESTWAILQKALVVLVSLDFEPRENATTSKPENPGGKASIWWVNTLPRAKRWPTPAGKDPGEFFTDHHGDLRAWLLAGLPPIFHVAAQNQGAHAGAPLPQNTATGRGGPMCPPASDLPAPYHGTITRGRAVLGRLYVVADDHRDIARLIGDYPDHAVFHRAEMAHYQGMSAAELDTMIMIRQQCPGSETVATLPAHQPELAL